MPLVLVVTLTFHLLLNNGHVKMVRGAYYSQTSRQAVVIDWSKNADWTEQFQPAEAVTLSAPQVNTVTLTGANGKGQAAGSATGDGNDRRLYLLKNFRARNVEARLSVNTAVAGGGQIGLAFRKQNNQAIVDWTNVVFGVSGQHLAGVWGWNGIGGLLDTNQQGTIGPIKTRIISANAAAGIVTVVSLLPTGLTTNDLVDLTGIDPTLPNAGAATVVNAFTFTVPTAVVGVFSTGNWGRYACFPRMFMGARLIENVFEIKQWYPWEGEPPWGDPLRTALFTLPAILAGPVVGGQALNNGRGEFGILLNHMGSTATLDVSSLYVASLDR